MAEIADEDLRAGDLRALARAATLDRESRPEAEALLRELAAHAGTRADSGHHRSAGAGQEHAVRSR